MQGGSISPTLTVSIVNWNAGELIIKCIDSVYNTIKKHSFEVVVVDNNSTDGSIQEVEKKFPYVHIIRNDTNVGYACAHNQVLKVAKSEYILLLNPDAILLENTVDFILNYMSTYKRIGIATAKVVSEDGTHQQTLVSFPTMKGDMARMLKSCVPYLGTFLAELIYRKNSTTNTYKRTDPVLADEAITGPFLMLRKNMLEDIGYLDESFFLFSEENDLCMRAKKKGWKRAYFPNLKVCHLLGKCREKAPSGFSIYHFHRSRIIFYSKHYGTLGGFCVRVLFLFFGSLDILTMLIKRSAATLTGKEKKGLDLKKTNGWHIIQAAFCSL